MRQRECARLHQAEAVHIGFKRSFQEGAENKAIHLIEDDFLVLEYWRPAKAFDVKTTRALKFLDAKRDDGDLLFHNQDPIFSNTPLHRS